MTTNKFIKKIIIKVVVLIIVCMGVFTFLSASGTILQNYIALGQMENEDSFFIINEMYNTFLEPVLRFGVYAFIGFQGYCIIEDINIYISKNKEKKENNSNENKN